MIYKIYLYNKNALVILESRISALSLSSGAPELLRSFFIIDLKIFILYIYISVNSSYVTRQ